MKEIQDQIEGFITTVTEAAGKLRILTRSQEAERDQARREFKSYGKQLDEANDALLNKSAQLDGLEVECERLRSEAVESRTEADLWRGRALGLGWKTEMVSTEDTVLPKTRKPRPPKAA